MRYHADHLKQKTSPKAAGSIYVCRSPRGPWSKAKPFYPSVQSMSVVIKYSLRFGRATPKSVPSLQTGRHAVHAL